MRRNILVFLLYQVSKARKCGMGESNSRSQFGKLMLYHLTNPARYMPYGTQDLYLGSGAVMNILHYFPANKERTSCDIIARVTQLRNDQQKPNIDRLVNPIDILFCDTNVFAKNLLPWIKNVSWVNYILCFFKEAVNRFPIHLLQKWCTNETIIVLGGH